MFRRFLANTCLVFFLPSIVMAGDWPQFLGPHRNGISTETGLIDTFPEGGPKVLWRCPLGTSMSGVAVVENVACTLYQDAANQYVTAINIETGEQLWKTPLAPAFENTMGNGPRGTPVIDGGNVFAMGGDGTVGSFQVEDGTPNWIIDPVKEIGGKSAEYGMACSPLVTDTHVIVTVGLPDATVVALDRATGKVVWTTGQGQPAGYSSPALLKIGDAVQLVVFHGGGVIGLVPDTGKEIWSYPYQTDYDCNIATPIEVNGHVLISSGENHGTTVLDVPSQSGGPVTEVWTSLGNRSVLRNEWQTSVLLDGYLYGLDNVGSAGPVTNLSCVDAQTGQLKWQQKRFGKSNLIAADGKLWCSTMDGELVIVNASSEKFEELGRALLIGKTRQAPTISNGKLFLRDDREVICVDVRE